MYITCKQCSTIFRLDESLLKPTGSKVRCSQCGSVFVEYPPKTKADKPVSAEVAAVQPTAEAPFEAAHDQELEGIDLDELDAIFDQGDAEPPVQEEDLEAQLTASKDDAAAEFEEADFDMDFDLDFDENDTLQASLDEEIAEEPSGEEPDELDLALDFEIEEDETGEAQPSAGPVEGDKGLAEDLGLDLEDLDFSLEDDMAETVAVDAGAKIDKDDGGLALEVDKGADRRPEAAEDDFDMSELDSLLELDEEDTKKAKTSELELEAEAPAPIPEEAGEKSDDFDLAELDNMLGGDDAPGRVSAGVSRDAVDEDAELALDESSGDEVPSESIPAMDADIAEESSEELDLSDLDAMLDEVDGPTDTGAEADDLEDLDFELDVEFEDKAIAKDDAGAAEAEQPQDEDLDLSDIEQMLGGDDDALDTQQLEADFLGLDSDSEEDADLELELDIDDTDEIDLDEIEASIEEAGGEPVEDAITMDDSAELDLELSLDELTSDEDEGQDLEMDDDIVLELESDDAVPSAAEEQVAGDDLDLSDLELDLGEDLETVPSAGKEQEADDDLDLSDLDLGEDLETVTESDVINGGDIELEFQVEEDEPALDFNEEPVKAVDKKMAPEDYQIDDTVPAMQPTRAPFETGIELKKKKKKKKAKKRTSKGLVFLFILLLLGAGGYYLYNEGIFQKLEIPHIPYVSEFLKLKPKDPSGILQLSTMDINSKFVDTKNSGRIFVIEGKVRNGYSVGRQMIRLQGKLYTKGKVLAKSEFSYAGVNITDQDLNALPIADLKKKLNSGIAQGAATKVNPGGSLPFMIIFSELPDQLDEFAIEIISSMQSK